MQKHRNLPKAFEELGVEIPILKALAKIGYEVPSDIQRELLPNIISGRDILGQARTGTGKTAAFGIPVLQRIDRNKGLQAICLAPTRELAVQVTGELRRLSEFTQIRCVPVYGGQRISTQVHALGRKPHVVVGTPGRVLDMMGRGHLDLSQIEYIILDEVDRMLDIGFRDDIRKILSRVPKKRQTVFVSATIDQEIRSLSMKFMRDPLEINVSQDRITVSEVDQFYLTAEQNDKNRALEAILAHDKPESVIVFTNTKHCAHRVAQRLHKKSIEAIAIHGDLMQKKREKALDRFRKHRINVLVATDLAARGIDIQNVTHIVNYDIPKDAEVYVHRIGRTARMGATGKAITLVTRGEGKQLTAIEQLINTQIEECEYPGYHPSQPDQDHSEVQQVSTSPWNEMQTAAIAEVGMATATAARTLGSRFKPARRRRL